MVQCANKINKSERLVASNPVQILSQLLEMGSPKHPKNQQKTKEQTIITYKLAN